MLKDSFQKMAKDIEALADGEVQETKAHLLINALEMAADLEIAPGYKAGSVRAFANGCDDNDFADAIRPMMTLFAQQSDLPLVRRALLTIFNAGVEAAWEEWPHNNVISRAKEREGLLRFLECKSTSRVIRVDYFAA